MTSNSSNMFKRSSQIGNCIDVEMKAEIPSSNPPTTMEEYYAKMLWDDALNPYWDKIAIALIVIVIIKFAFQPINRIKTLSDVGWSHLLQRGSFKRTLRDMIKEVQRMRKIGDLPPIYPNGWFAVDESRNLSIGKVNSVQCLGETLAVFRAHDGQVHVLDAYCPHLGANMAVGGVVKGDCLECPFHGWLFSGKSGSCTHIPYAAKVPDFAKVKKYASKECNGFIFIWFDAEDRGPRWEIPVMEEIETGTFIYRGRTQHQILAHIQEIPENGSDLAHLGHLHVPNVIKGADLFRIFSKNAVLDIASHEWNGTWRALEEPRSHVAEVALTHSFSLFGGRFKILEMRVSIEQIGPALVILRFDTCFGKGILVQTVTPQEPLRQQVIHQFYSSSLFLAPFAKFIILGEAYHVERDIMIWNSKKYLSKPLLVSEDKLISKFRRWYSQFYSANSPKLESIRKDTLEW